MHNAKASFAAV